MAVHVPLSIEAQLEAKTLMMAPDNIFLPSSGKPVTVPSQDMILGLYYLMHDPLYSLKTTAERPKMFGKTWKKCSWRSTPAAASTGLKRKKRERATMNSDAAFISMRRSSSVCLDSGIIETTPGRVIFNTIVPKELGFQNYSLRKKKLSELILETYKKVGLEATVSFLDNLKNLGFAEATKAALSMGVKDVRVPENKQKVIDGA
jgi:DNA-directed RNA polymerase subunit beta'